MSAFLGAAACQPDQAKKPAEDLSWLDSLDVKTPAVDSAVVSPTELGLQAAPSPTAQALAAPAEAPAAATHRASTTHRATTHRATHRSSGSSASSGSSEPIYSAPRTRTVTHTKRDAIIGAGTGAVIGAVAGGGRHRVKGAIIGGAAGAAVGAIFGHKVDKQQVQW
jgi:hypothetical protein